MMLLTLPVASLVGFSLLASAAALSPGAHTLVLRNSQPCAANTCVTGEGGLHKPLHHQCCPAVCTSHQSAADGDRSLCTKMPCQATHGMTSPDLTAASDIHSAVPCTLMWQREVEGLHSQCSIQAQISPVPEPLPQFPFFVWHSRIFMVFIQSPCHLSHRQCIYSFWCVYTHLSH